VLEDNWYDSIESLQSIEDTFWTENKFPARLIQAIKAELNRDSDMEDAHKPAVLKLDTAKPVAPAEPEPREVHIDEEMKEANGFEEYVHLGRSLLQAFFKETGFVKETILPSMKILTKVVENLANDPMEPKFRRINTTKKPVQEKLLKWKTLVSFLENLGFTKGESEMNMVGFNSELIRGFYDAIIEEMKTNTEAFGVTVSSGFDPYAQHSSSTTGER